MNILILGSGGREHTFAWKSAQSPLCDNLYVAPGNAGTSAIAQNVAIDINDFEAVKELCLDKNIGLLIVGPEEPLVNGIKDFFTSNISLQHISFVGPDKLGAQLEGSKDFSKAFMQKYGIPTAQSLTVTLAELNEGNSFLDTLKAPYVLKADGLAAGKGVIITENLIDAKSSLKEMLEGQFGVASKRVVIEEFLDGIELSVFVLTDGNSYKILPEAKDYKRIGEGDTGLNTGGMGAISPVPFADEDFMQRVESQVIGPTIDGIKQEGMDYKGFVFIGLMNIDGNPFVIEYNVRMGDPETEVVLPRIESDIVELFHAAANSKLEGVTLKVSNQTATTVVGVTEGYPNAYEKGKVMSGFEKVKDGIVFHAGTKAIRNNTVTNGGRVIASTGLGDDMASALAISYANLKKITWEGMNYRSDIGKDLEKYM